MFYRHANLQRTYKEICHARQKLSIIRGPMQGYCQPRCHSQHNVKQALLRLSVNVEA
jgi:hypothetical protein